ncbi:MAG: hypothetical protein ACO31E_02905 [Phycisphaerales bacterium]
MHSTPITANHRRARRGNTIVLVTAILVLLVIIATAFISRTNAVRQTSAAQLSSAGRDGRAESIGVNVAQEIAGALFAKPVSVTAAGAPIDPFVRVDASVTPPVLVASSSWPRDPAPLNAQRYSIDRDALDGSGLPLYGYNIAPYEVKAWTNWPDFFGGASPWPFGPGSPGGILVDGIGRSIADENPYGNPGMGDTRWLRSTEPERLGLDQSGDGVPDIFTFWHWSHLSWLPTANNGWRVVPDISNIDLNTVENLNENAAAPYAVAMPYEQWLPNVFPVPVTSAAEFQQRVNNWFFNYQNSYTNPGLALPNFIRLKDLGKPTDEFRDGTTRNVVSRTFTDADGDGFTDSFWFLAPTPTERSIRTIVGVSVVDNSALLNANIATKFSFDNTLGATPSDLALVTSAGEFQPINSNGATVGFFDGPVNQPSTQVTGVPASNGNNSPLPTYWTGAPQISFQSGLPRFSRSRYGDAPPFTTPLSYLQSIGMRTPTGGIDSGAPGLGLSLNDQTLDPALPRATFESPLERLSWFKIVGGDPEQPRFGLTPFDAADEFELRAYHGNNMPGVLSRFEQAVNLFSPGINGDTSNDFQFLRSSVQREEADEYLDQLDARQLLVDNRRKLTLFNGARNETMPPALWVTPYFSQQINYMNAGGSIPPTSDPDYNAFQQANFNEWQRQKFKVDLREPLYVDGNGNPALTRNPFAAFQWRRDMTRLLETTLTATTTNSLGQTVYQSYYGDRQADFRRTRSMIASYVANLDCASDEAVTVGATGVAVDRPLYPSPPSADPNGYFPPTTDAMQDPNWQDRFYLGMEKQPFIMEVFFGLVYPKSDFNEGQWPGEDPPVGEEELPPDIDDGGENFVDSSSDPSAVIAVQIANPYDTPISLGDFRLEFYGKIFNFTVGSIAAGYGPNPVLPAATLGKPSTAIVYAVEAGAVGDYPAGAFRAAILDFFDIERGEVQGTIVQPTDLDGDGQIEYATLYDSRGPSNDPDVDPLDRTLVFDATAAWVVTDVNAPGAPSATNGRYTDPNEQPVRILRNITPPPGVSGGPVQVVVDRFDNEFTGPEVKFNEAVNRLFTDAAYIPPEQRYFWDPNPVRRYISGIRIRDNDFYMTWCRASRIWAWDVDSWDDAGVPMAQKRISALERSPRYVFSMATEPVRAERLWDGVSVNGAPQDNQYKGDCWKIGDDPDGDQTGQGRWVNFTFVDMFGRNLRGKPVFFTNQVAIAPGGTEVISALGAGPMPFLPSLGLASAPGDVYPQDCHGIVEIGGSQFEWMIGNKGCSRGDWERFQNILTAQIPFQMTQKDSDFEQTAEIFDVFLWGHVFEGWGGNPETLRTFSEIMLDDDPDSEFYPGTGIYVNRLWIRPPGELAIDDPGTPVIGGRFDPNSTTNPPAPVNGYRPWRPALPMGVALLDALTIDGPGRNAFDRNVNSQVYVIQNGVLVGDGFDRARAEERSFRLAGGFSGTPTRGLVNLNTAPPEVIQAMPLMTRLAKNNQGSSPYSHLVDAIRSYRERGLFGAPTPFNTSLLPTYADRGLSPSQVTSGGLGAIFPGNLPRFFPAMRGERGFASIGELMLLNRLPDESVPPGLRASYTTRWLGYDPYADYATGGFGDFDIGYSWATDRTNPRPRQLPEDILGAITPDPDPIIPFKQHDEPLGDAEDFNLMVKGISNLVTTRSDVFTVYLKIRQVKQDDVKGIWDGTRKDLIVDDSRYVMCVDRSNCNSPSDQPRIVYFQKCP